MKTCCQITFALPCFVVATLLSATTQARCKNGVCTFTTRNVATYTQPTYVQPQATVSYVSPVQVTPVIVSSAGENVFQPVPMNISQAVYSPVTMTGYSNFAVQPVYIPLATGEAAHTPLAEVTRVLGLLPRPQVAFVDFGCGYDARWCVAAAERWKCKCVGVEIDPSRAAAARDRVRNLGLDNLITIVEGDAAEVPVTGDVAVAYLYPETLVKLKPRLQKFRAVASYIHQPPGLYAVKSGDTWIYNQQVQQPQMMSSHGAVWGGQVYSGRVCNNPNCAMCNSIGWQLGQ